MKTSYLDLEIVEWAGLGLDDYLEKLHFETVLSSSFCVIDSFARQTVERLNQISGSNALNWVNLVNFTGSDTQRFQAAFNAACTGSSKTLYIPKGTYTLTRAGSYTLGLEYAVFVTGADGLNVIAEPGVRIVFPSSRNEANYCHAFLFMSCSNVMVNGLTFSGSTWDMTNSTNHYAGLYVYDRCLDWTVTNNRTYGAVLLTQASNEFAGRMFYSNNRHFDSPSAITIGRGSVIVDNWFIHSSRSDNSSHAVYLYGTFDDIIFARNHGKNISKNFIKYRGAVAYHDRKSKLVIANNSAENCQYGYEVGADTEVVHQNVIISDNAALNCDVGIYCFSAADVIISSNNIEHNCLSTVKSGSGIVLQNSSMTEVGATATSGNGLIVNNVLTQNAGWVGTVILTQVPSEGDSVTVGTETYTFTTSSSVSKYTVQIGTLSDTSQRLADKIRGRYDTTSGSFNNVLLSTDDVSIEPSAFSPQKIIVNSLIGSYTLTGSGQGIVTSGPVRHAVTCSQQV